jgi:hypothetical protein
MWLKVKLIIRVLFVFFKHLGSSCYNIIQNYVQRKLCILNISFKKQNFKIAYLSHVILSEDGLFKAKYVEECIRIPRENRV